MNPSAIAERITALPPEKQTLLIERMIAQGISLSALPILPAPSKTTAPLTASQQRLWVFDQLSPGDAAYNMPAAIRLTGTLDIASLRYSLETIIERHTILRSAFIVEQSTPVQRINPPQPLHIEHLDLSGQPESEREAAVSRLAVASAQAPFNLADGEMLRTTLVCLTPTDHMLMLVSHHIASDGWSTGILVQELSQLYAAKVLGQPMPLDPLPIQYADFARWQQGQIQGALLEQQLDYWRKQLADAPTLLNLPTDFPRPAQQTFRGAKQPFRIDDQLADRLRQLSLDHGVTLFTTLLAAFQVLLYRYSNQDDIVVGMPVAGRNRLETEGLIGLFINTLPLRSDLSGNPAFSDLLRSVNEMLLQAQSHQDLPFEQMVDALKPPRSLSHPPLYQVMIVLQDYRDAIMQLPDLTVRTFPLDNATAKFDITLNYLLASDGQLQGNVEYNTDLFSAETITHFTHHLLNLLNAIVDTPTRPIAKLPLLSTAESDRLLTSWNNSSSRDYPLDQTLSQLFQQQATQTPDAPAAVFGAETLSYRQLDARSSQLAQALISGGVQPNQFVGVCVDRSLDMIVALLAVLKSGAAYVPLDPAFPQERLAYMLADSEASILITQSNLTELLSFPAEQTIHLDRDWDDIAQLASDAIAPRSQADDLAYAIYTSGSTGKPKGVQIEQRSLVNFLLSMRETVDISAEDSLVAVTTPSFDIAALELYLPLIVGATLVIAPYETTIDSQRLIQLLDASSATMMQATPITWRMLVDTGWPQTPTLSVLSGGEALAHDLAQRLLAKSPKVWNLYGPTETTIWSTALRLPGADALNPLPSGSVSIGKAIANTQLYILDGEQQPVPVGVPGELYIGGVGVARGYRNRPKLNAERFVTLPTITSDQNQVYRSGDLARYLADGTIEFLGRIDSQVKVRGFRIELGDIESNLAQHPNIRQASVIATPDARGIQQLVGYIVTEDGTALSTSDLRLFLQDKLPAYMLPSIYVALEALPLTANGKVNRRALPKPQASRPEAAVYLAPASAVEAQIAAIFAEQLGVEKIGRNDNFFDLGAHSFLLAQIHRQIQDELKREIAVIDLFKYPSISALAAFLDQPAASLEPKVDALKARENKRRNAMKTRRPRPKRPQRTG